MSLTAVGPQIGERMLFDWDEANIAHIARHGVTPQEVEEVLLNDPIDLKVNLRNGEERTEQIGETITGRILQVITTPRNGMIRPITALSLRTRWHPWYFELKEQRNARDTSIS
jgi:uncharacterized protein